MKHEPCADPTTASPGGALYGDNGIDSSRKGLQSHYQSLKTLINDESKQIGSPDSDVFSSVMGKVERLHQLVKNPKEQVTDAEALLDLTSSLVTGVKAHCKDGITASDFVTCLLRDFNQHDRPSTSARSDQNSIAWKNIGVEVSHVFRNFRGCPTMIGPMDKELKQRNVTVRRKHLRPLRSEAPKEVVNSVAQEKTETDKKMVTMFNVLKKHGIVRLENLVLNRSSFAQTVENLFALSFLVKDGRAEIKVAENGTHLVVPRNAPAARAVASGNVVYGSFIFRFDFKDWKLMSSSVKEGEELMPTRKRVNSASDTQADQDLKIPKHSLRR